MPDQKKAIKDIYDEGIQEIEGVLFSLDSTPSQIKVAKQSLADLTAMLLAHTLETVQSRTALLAGLIVELNQVIAKVQTKPAHAETMKKLTAIATKAQGLLTNEKKDLII